MDEIEFKSTYMDEAQFKSAFNEQNKDKIWSEPRREDELKKAWSAYQADVQKAWLAYQKELEHTWQEGASDFSRGVNSQRTAYDSNTQIQELISRVFKAKGMFPDWQQVISNLEKIAAAPDDNLQRDYVYYPEMQKLLGMRPQDYIIKVQHDLEYIPIAKQHDQNNPERRAVGMQEYDKAMGITVPKTVDEIVALIKATTEKVKAMDEGDAVAYGNRVIAVIEKAVSDLEDK